MSALVEVAANLVTSQVKQTPMSTDQIISEIRKVYICLKNLDSRQQMDVVDVNKPSITLKQAFLKDEVVCMICGKRGLKALGRHLTTVHNMSASSYRKEFGIPRTQALTAKSYSQARRKSALELGLGDKLAKARGARMASFEPEEFVATGGGENIVDEAVAVI